MGVELKIPVRGAPRASSTYRLEEAGEKPPYSPGLARPPAALLKAQRTLLDNLTPAAPAQGPRCGLCILPLRRPQRIKPIPGQFTLTYSGLPCRRLGCRKGPLWFGLHENLEGFVSVWGLPPLHPTPILHLPPSFGFIQGLTHWGRIYLLSACPDKPSPTSPSVSRPHALLPASLVQGSPANPTRG